MLAKTFSFCSRETEFLMPPTQRVQGPQKSKHEKIKDFFCPKFEEFEGFLEVMK